MTGESMSLKEKKPLIDLLFLISFLSPLPNLLIWNRNIGCFIDGRMRLIRIPSDPHEDKDQEKNIKASDDILTDTYRLRSDLRGRRHHLIDSIFDSDDNREP
jgi:hypothetical protein